MKKYGGLESESDEERQGQGQGQGQGAQGQGAQGQGAQGQGPAPVQGMGGRRRSRRHHRRHHKTLRAVPKGVHVKAKTLRRLLKSKGLRVSGKKSTLRARARKAHLIRGGGPTSVPSSTAASV